MVDQTKQVIGFESIGPFKTLIVVPNSKGKKVKEHKKMRIEIEIEIEMAHQLIFSFDPCPSVPFFYFLGLSLPSFSVLLVREGF